MVWCLDVGDAEDVSMRTGENDQGRGDAEERECVSLEGQTLRREQVSEPKWRVAPGGKEVSCYIQQRERAREGFAAGMLVGLGGGK